VILVSTLKATKKTDNNQIKLVSSDYSQGQAPVEPLALPGVTRHINKFFGDNTNWRVGGLDGCVSK